MVRTIWFKASPIYDSGGKVLIAPQAYLKDICYTERNHKDIFPLSVLAEIVCNKAISPFGFAFLTFCKLLLKFDRKSIS